MLQYFTTTWDLFVEFLCSIFELNKINVNSEYRKNTCQDMKLEALDVTDWLEKYILQSHFIGTGGGRLWVR